jgi:hypothetical protein
VYNERRRVTSSAKRKRRHSDNTLHQVVNSASYYTCSQQFEKNLMMEFFSSKSMEGI